MTIEAQQAEAARHDRELRAQIDPLVARLTPLGKYELCLRVFGQAIAQQIRDPAPGGGLPVGALVQLPPVDTGD